jgi:ribonuclease PH
VTRRDGRSPDQLRPVTITVGWQETAYASALVELGRTKVICAVTYEDRVPPFLRGSGKGWVTSEYAMLPGATSERSAREVTKGRPGGRTHEIQRLIGRSLRAVADTEAFGEATLWVDCDVVQADGGTRCASITGAWVALFAAAHRLMQEKRVKTFPLRDHVAAVSVGMVDGTPYLDLPYDEDVRAETDMNVVMTGLGGLVEVQGTAEREPFSRADLDALLDLAGQGIQALVRAQKQALGPMLEEASIPPLRRLALGPAQLDLSDGRSLPGGARGPSPSGARGPAR